MTMLTQPTYGTITLRRGELFRPQDHQRSCKTLRREIKNQILQKIQKSTKRTSIDKKSSAAALAALRSSSADWA